LPLTPIAKQEFLLLLEEEELKSVPVLVLANKQDMQGALPEGEISNALGLHSIKNRPWGIYKTSAVTGAGLKESLNWLVDELAGK
jgi:ADP-ribosylation factor-like protein 1